ncbi:transmembrane protein 79 isoform X1 [Pangasianodon hypophthalmus]|uniref:transmembrane protein 79 isoform X1 n=2 Tax=Pangasianodon hypophthalmus TaxID=310915 RepID=UPI000F00014E|nr:transmembrane protein 79 isoform X1 [Pangasianodon hypophthalmus]
MSEDLSSDSVPMVKPPLVLKPEPSVPDCEREKKINTDMKRTGEKISGADMEPSTLPWPGDKADQFGKIEKAASDLKLEQSEMDLIGEKGSERSDSGSLRAGVSRTESEREFGGREKRATCEDCVEGKQPELREKVPHLEIEVEEMNSMPEKAAGVFSPSVSILRSTSMPEPPRRRSEMWKEENQAFLGNPDIHPDEYSYHEYPRQNNLQICSCAGTYRDVLKMGVSIFMSALIFPVLVWGGHTFLPFDAPLLDSAPLRLVYTLRCSVFAVIPIALGVLVLGVSRVRYRSLKPHCDGEVEEVNIHRRYVDDSVSLFLLYFLQLGVMAAYLNQNLLKLVPLLTIIFAIGRLVYWIAAAWGSSLRGFGFGFSFLPMLTMLVANLYFIFMADSAGSIFAQDDMEPPNPPQEYRQRFWG